MKVIFKDVGQGDSILLEWEHRSKKKLRIIDCNLKKGRNSVLDYIRNNNFEEIEFIILTHPHFDHFSGIRSILEYCEQKKIKILRFLHTSFQVPQYLKSAVKSPQASSELAKLFKKIKDLWSSKKIIQYQSYISDDIKPIEITDDIKLEVLAPSTIEFDNFITKTFTNAEENSHSNPHGNWLSTVLKIYDNNWYILLTSDVEISALKRIGYSKKNEFKSNLILCQSPHHGSKKNHSNIFWRNLKKNESKVVFSVGKNSYGHPSNHVVNKFKSYNYKIFSTNLVGGLLPEENPKNSETFEKEVLLENLDIFDEPKKTSNKFEGDKVFKIKDGFATLVNED